MSFRLLRSESCWTEGDSRSIRPAVDSRGIRWYEVNILMEVEVL